MMVCTHVGAGSSASLPIGQTTKTWGVNLGSLPPQDQTYRSERTWPAFRACCKARSLLPAGLGYEFLAIHFVLLPFRKLRPPWHDVRLRKPPPASGTKEE